MAPVSKKVSVVPKPAEVPVVEQITPVDNTIVKKETKKKESKKKEDSNVVIVEPEQTQPPVVVEPVNDSTDVIEESIIGNIIDKFTALSLQVKAIQVSLKVLAKEYEKQKKIIDKVQKKKDKAKKSPSGFAKPCKISNELCDFVGVSHGSELSRTDITRHINAYVKEHNLNNPENRREFFPDKKLKAILSAKEGEKVTYFILQRLIAHHFPQSASKLAATIALNSNTVV